MNWPKILQFAAKLPLVVTGIMRIVEAVKSASGPEKKAAVKSAILQSVALTEFVTERDLLNDPEVSKLYDAAIDAQHAADKAWDAVRAVLVKKVT